MQVKAERFGNRIYVRMPYSPGNVEKCKQIAGARWRKTAKAWSYPLDWQTCKRLRKVWGDDLTLGPELTAWGRDQRGRREELNDILGATTNNKLAKVKLDRVPVVAPTMWAALQNRPYQPAAVKYMATARRSLNGDQPGIGKTIESLGALIEGGVTGPVLILAPRKSTRVVWVPEIDRWLEDLDMDWSVTRSSAMSPARREQAFAEHAQMCADYPDGIHFLVANAEQVRVRKDTTCPAGICAGDEDWCPEADKHKDKSVYLNPYLFKTLWSAIIADETHKWLINTRGKRASQVGYGFTRLRDNEDGMRHALSGTPLKGKKHNLFGTLNWLWPKVYTSKWRWIETYFNVYEDGYSRSVGNLLKDERKAFFEELDNIMIRRTKEEIHRLNPEWMPPNKVWHAVEVDLDPAQRKAYDAMLKGAQASIDGGTLTASGVLAELTRLRQFAGCSGKLVKKQRKIPGSDQYEDYMHFQPTMPSAKFDWLLEFLEERGIEQGTRKRPGDLSDSVQKVVVGSQFTQFIDLWAEELEAKGIGCFKLTGATSDRVAMRDIKHFQEQDDIRVYLLNIQAGGVSITLDAADDCVVMDETWDPDTQEQFEDRVHRAGRTDHQVDIWYVRAEDTIEVEMISPANEVKGESNHYILDANRGLAFARERFAKQKKEKAK